MMWYGVRGGRRYNVTLILRKTGVWMAGNANLTQKTIKKCQFICPNGRKGVILHPIRQNSLVETHLKAYRMTSNSLIIGIIDILLHRAVGSGKVRR